MELNNIIVRAIEPEDLDFIYKSENCKEYWKWGNQNNLFSKYDLKQFIENSHAPITTSLQKRFIVCNSDTNSIIGSIDLFDLDNTNRRIEVGLIIYNIEKRGKKIGENMLDWVKFFCFNELSLHQIYAQVQSSNTQAIKLFEKMKYEKCGVKKDWIIKNNQWQDVIEFQLIHNQN